MRLDAAKLKQIAVVLGADSSYNDSVVQTLQKIVSAEGGSTNRNRGEVDLLKAWLDAIGGESLYNDTGDTTLRKILEQYGGGDSLWTSSNDKLALIYAQVSAGPTPPDFDPDAASFFTRAGITDETQKDAVNDLVVGLKAASLWTLMHAIYPFVGGNASAHSKNLTSDSRHITWFSDSPTHNSTGIKGNGINQGGTTDFDASELGANCGISAYVNPPSSDESLDDVYYAGSGATVVYGVLRNADFAREIGRSGNLSVNFDSASPRNGLIAMNRTSNTLAKLHRNGSAVAQNTDNNSGASPEAMAIGVLCRWNGSDFESCTDGGLSLLALHSGMADPQAAEFYTLVQSYQTALGRNV